MHYIIRCRKTADGIERRIVWKDRKGVVAHTHTVHNILGDDLARAIEQSYTDMRSKGDKRRGRAEKGFLRLTTPPETPPK